METRIDKVYKFERRIERIKAEMQKAAIEIKKMEKIIKSYENQVNMLRKSIADNPGLEWGNKK